MSMSQKWPGDAKTFLAENGYVVIDALQQYNNTDFRHGPEDRSRELLDSLSIRQTMETPFVYHDSEGQAMPVVSYCQVMNKPHGDVQDISFFVKTDNERESSTMAHGYKEITDDIFSGNAFATKGKSGPAVSYREMRQELSRFGAIAAGLPHVMDYREYREARDGLYEAGRPGCVRSDVESYKNYLQAQQLQVLNGSTFVGKHASSEAINDLILDIEQNQVDVENDVALMKSSDGVLWPTEDRYPEEVPWPPVTRRSLSFEKAYDLKGLDSTELFDKKRRPLPDVREFENFLSGEEFSL